MQAIVYNRAKVNVKNKAKAESISDANEGNIKQIENEKNKYTNFWIGVYRGIQIDSRNPKIIDRFNTRSISLDKETLKINPSGQFKTIWDLFIGLLVIYSIIINPFRIAFLPSVHHNPLDTVEWVITALFFVDLCINCITAYVDDETDRIIYDTKSIIKRYVKFWFWIDFLSTIPFDAIIEAAVGSANLGFIRIIRILRLVKLIKLYRLMGIEDYLQMFRINPAFVSLGIFMLVTLFIAHIYACFWYYIAIPGLIQEETWVSVFGFSNASVGACYVASFYFIIITMLTIGLGDIHAVNNIERLYSIVVMFTGGIIFGALISRVATLIEQQNPQAKEFKRHIAELKFFLSEFKFPKELTRRVKEAYAYYLRKKSSYGEVGFHEDLPLPVMHRLIKELHNSDIQAIKLFHTYEKDFIVSLLISMKPFQAIAGENIYKEGDVMNEIVFVKRGQVDMTISDGRKFFLIGNIYQGNYFGDSEYLQNVSSMGNYRAVVYCELLSIGHNQFDLASRKCYSAGVRFKEEIELRFKNLIEVINLRKDQERDTFKTLVRNSSTYSNKPKSARLSTGSTTTIKDEAAVSAATEGFQDDSMIHQQQGIYRSLRNPSSSIKYLTYRIVNGYKVVNTDELIQNTSQSYHLGFLTDETEFTISVLYYDNDDKVRRVGDRNVDFLKEKHLIYINGPYKVLWDGFISLLIIYSILIIPLEIAYNQQAYNCSDIVDLVISGFFLFDMVLCFKTAYFDTKLDCYVTVNSMIAKQYLSTWFFLDLVASFPYGLITTYFTSPQLRLFRVVKILRIMRLFRIAKLMNLINYIHRMENYFDISPILFDLLTMIIFVYLVSHWVACILWGMSTIISLDRWYDDPAFGLQINSLLSKYIVSLYFAVEIISTVGYGDITPINTGERILIIIVVIFASSVFGYMAANVAGLVANMNAASKEKFYRMSQIIEYLDEKQCSNSITDQVTHHFKQLFKDSSAFDTDRILSRLPQRLANEVQLFHYGKQIKLIALLNYIDNISVRLFLFQMLKRVYYEKDQIIAHEGHFDNAISFIVSGSVLGYKKIKNNKEINKINKSVNTKTSILTKRFKTKLMRTLHGGSTRSLNNFILLNDITSKVENSSKILYDNPINMNDYDYNFENDDVNFYDNSYHNQYNSQFSDKLSTKSFNNNDNNHVYYDEGIIISDNNNNYNTSNDNSSNNNSSSNNNNNNSSNNNVQSRIINKMNYLHKSSSTGKFEPTDINETDELLDISTDEYIFDQKLDTGINYDIEDNTNADIQHVSRENDSIFNDVASINESIISNKKQSAPPASSKSVFCIQNNNIELEELKENTNSFLGSYSNTYHHDDLEKLGYDLVCTLKEGDFFGHLSVMHKVPSKASMLAISHCIVYELHISKIAKVIKIEPTVAIQLQEALSQAISAQSDVLGKLNMRTKRARILKSYKRKFYKNLTKGRSIIKSNKIKSTILQTNKAINFSNALSSSHSNQSLDESDEDEDQDDNHMDNNSSTHSKLTTTKFSNFSKRFTRLDKILTKQNMFYISDDDEEKERNKNKYSRKILVQRSLVRKSLRMRTSELILSTNNSQRIVNKQNKDIKYEVKRRTMSLTDLDTIDPLLSPYNVSLAGHWSTDIIVDHIPIDDNHTSIVPLYYNLKAFRYKKIERRQSFPSYDFQIWKINNFSQGIY